MAGKILTIPQWIPSDVTLISNPKVGDLSDILEIPRVYVLGHLHAFWHYVFKHFNSGVIVGRNLESKIATDGAEWKGDAKLFIDALLECRFLHKTDDATIDVCASCFGPDENGDPFPQVDPGGYFVHDWNNIMFYWRLNQKRKELKRAQDAARQRAKRESEKFKSEKGPGMIVSERPEIPYQPIRRGLRAAPRLVRQEFRHAIKSVTSREKRRDVTLMSQNTPSKNTPVIDPSKLTNVLEAHAYSSVTQKSPHIRYINAVKDNDKDKDKGYGEPLKNRGDSPEPFLFSQSKDVREILDFYRHSLLRVANRSLTTHHEIRLVGAVKRALSQHPKSEILVHLGRWFDSPWPWVRDVALYRFDKFMNLYERLRAGPLVKFETQGGITDDGMDKPKKLETRDDF